MSFRMTAEAAREILAAAERSSAAGMALRVAARPQRGEPGLAYALGFDEPAPQDAVTVVEGLTVLVGPESQDLLAGTVLDYVELDTGARDFVFVPPSPQDSACTTPARACGSGRCAGCS